MCDSPVTSNHGLRLVRGKDLTLFIAFILPVSVVREPETHIGSWDYLCTQTQLQRSWGHIGILVAARFLQLNLVVFFFLVVTVELRDDSGDYHSSL